MSVLRIARADQWLTEGLQLVRNASNSPKEDVTKIILTGLSANTLP